MIVKPNQENIVDIAIEAWHDSGASLEDWLGWSPKEYADWVSDSAKVPRIPKHYAAFSNDIEATQALQAENERLRAALKPFAEVADHYDDREDDNFEVWIDAGPERIIRQSFELRKYRAARTALESGSSDDADD